MDKGGMLRINRKIDKEHEPMIQNRNCKQSPKTRGFLHSSHTGLLLILDHSVLPPATGSLHRWFSLPGTPSPLTLTW